MTTNGTATTRTAAQDRQAAAARAERAADHDPNAELPEWML